jgi:hypothetical protein
MGVGSADKISCARATGTHREITITVQQHTVTRTEAITAGRRLDSELFLAIAHDHSLADTARAAGARRFKCNAEPAHDVLRPTFTQTSGERRVVRHPQGGGSAGCASD